MRKAVRNLNPLVVIAAGAAALVAAILVNLIIGLAAQPDPTPAKGLSTVPQAGSCSQALRALLAAGPPAGHQEANTRIARVREERQDCLDWDPLATGAPREDMCGHRPVRQSGRIGDLPAPPGLQGERVTTVMMPMTTFVGSTPITTLMPMQDRSPNQKVQALTGTDRQGNVLIHFAPGRTPADGRSCWLYSARQGRWAGE